MASKQTSMGRNKPSRRLLSAVTLAACFTLRATAQALPVSACPNLPEYAITRAIRTTCPEPLIFQGKDTYEWTQPISCIKAGVTPQKEEAQKCLFTAGNFGDLHGTSIIADPESVTDLHSADAVSDRPFYGRGRNFTAGPLVSEEGPAYVIRPSAGKGLGVFARRKIRQGEIFMLDFPSLLLSDKFIKESKPNLRRRLIKRALQQLPRDTKDKTLRLARATGGEKLDDIMGTNSVSVSMGDGESFMGLFPELARINHACNPNSYYKFSHRTLSLEVVAYRHIQPGEEITISYSHLTVGRTGRLDFLEKNYKFKCGCSLCRSNTTVITASEDRRRAIHKLRKRVVEAVQSEQHLGALELARELYDTTTAEGVPALQAEFNDIIAAISLDMEDFKAARKYGLKSLAGWKEFNSVDDFQLQVAKYFVDIHIPEKEAAVRKREAWKDEPDA